MTDLQQANLDHTAVQHTTIQHTAVQHTMPVRLLARTAVAWLVAGLAVAVYVEVAGADPVGSTFSEYVNSETGEWLVGVAMLMLGGCAFSLVGASPR